MELEVGKRVRIGCRAKSSSSLRSRIQRGISVDTRSEWIEQRTETLRLKVRQIAKSDIEKVMAETSKSRKNVSREGYEVLRGDRSGGEENSERISDGVEFRVVS